MDQSRKQVDWEKIKSFRPAEFDDPGYPGSWIYLNPDTIYELDRLRQKTGWKIITHNKCGLKGCVCVDPVGHSKDSLHYVRMGKLCSAVDWHFETDVDPRQQAREVLKSGFTGVGVYYDWRWIKPLSVAFHTDMRPRPQVWVREDGEYFYLLK
ncbi:MAG: hypothetical protein ABIK15_07220 [Pseudomonadota bacterium]